MTDSLLAAIANDDEWCECARKFQQLSNEHKALVRTLVDSLHRQTTQNKPTNVIRLDRVAK